jgi:hypothetical protein
MRFSILRSARMNRCQLERMKRKGTAWPERAAAQSTFLEDTATDTLTARAEARDNKTCIIRVSYYMSRSDGCF